MLFLLLSSGAEGANWLKVGEVKGRTILYVDPDTVNRTGEMIGAKTREVQVEPVGVGDEDLVEVTGYTEFRCGRNQFRPMETTYLYKSGKTERIASEGMRTWKTINRESTRILYDYLCKRPNASF